ncbi:MAG: YggS family pyridoxal phosphate-dependent enzyme [Gemmatimonadaceae bacterium]
MLFADLAERLAEVRGRIDAAVKRGGHDQQVTIVAVTKSHGADAVLAAWKAGLRDVGENRVQEGLRKMAEVEVPVRWHLIGHLQRNKAANVSRFTMLHSLDSLRLADAVNEVGLTGERPVDALVQVNVSGEGSKGGVGAGELPAEAERLLGLRGIRVGGVMTMAPLDADEGMLRTVFQRARAARDVLTGVGHPALGLSMGMSNDFVIAVEEGATMVRLGTVLFGERGT